METPGKFLHLTSQFSLAIDYARQVHVSYRKGTEVPYMAHLLGVAALVLVFHGIVQESRNDQVLGHGKWHMAALSEGGLPRLRDIEANFGKEVAATVEGCSDTTGEDSGKKQSWESRKASYIARLWNEPQGTLLVSAADKLYNARAILEDYRIIGEEVWKRFKRCPKEQLWYFDEIIKVYKKRCPNWRIVEELKRTVAELARLSAQESSGG